MRAQSYLHDITDQTLKQVIRLLSRHIHYCTSDINVADIVSRQVFHK